MEDDEEIQSYQNGAQPVTVAAVPAQRTLTLALPIQQPKSGGGGAATGGGGGGGREDCWSEGATAVLIEAWGERYLELSRGNLKQKHWKEVADIVGSREDYTKPPKTDVQCKNRIDTLKKKYKLEKSKIGSGQDPSKWTFFHRLDQLIGPNSKISAPAPAANAPMLVPPGKAQVQVPVAIPVEFGRPRRSMESNSSEAPESSDSFPPETGNRKRARVEKEPKRVRRGNSMRELTQAILELGEAYERAETSKLLQFVEMEKQRMGFAKELELQRMHFFIKTQLELSQLNQGRRACLIPVNIDLIPILVKGRATDSFERSVEGAPDPMIAQTCIFAEGLISK